VAGLVGVCIAGMVVAAPATSAGHAAAAGGSAPAHPAFGLAMVFVLYAYGGWNEASYLAGDVKRGPRGLAIVLLGSTLAIAAIYAVVNLAYLRALGFEGLRGSSAPASDVMSLVFGKTGEVLLAVLAAVTALGSANATTFTGSRAVQALGVTHGSLRWLSSIHPGHRTPLNAFVTQGAIAVSLVLAAGLLGDQGRHGFEVAVSYTAPAFWGFMALIGLVAVGTALHHPGTLGRRLGFVTAAVAFTGMCGYMLYSSIAYAGVGAMLGLVIVGVGVPVYALVRALDARCGGAEAGAEAGAETEAVAAR
jgi:basic amino acid/polyamine antiporter, APA family